MTDLDAAMNLPEAVSLHVEGGCECDTWWYGDTEADAVFHSHTDPACQRARIEAVSKVPRFALYGGQSADGRGPGVFAGWTWDREEAELWADENRGNPYSTGYVEEHGPEGIRRL